MRTSRKGSVEMPAFVRQLVKETEKRVTSFFKGGRGGGAGELSEGEEGGEEEGVIPSPYLDRPVLDKHMQEGCASWGLTYALASMQGWRAHMEDFHNCFPQLGGELAHWGFFAVYDGHAGSVVAQHCSRNLLDHILGTGEQQAVLQTAGRLSRYKSRGVLEDQYPAEICSNLPQHTSLKVSSMPKQGSLDNISIILVCFPAAPQLSPEALHQEAELEDFLESKVAEIFEELSATGDEPDLLSVLTVLASTVIPGLPPGGGLQSKRNCIISAYYQQKEVRRSRLAQELSPTDAN
ncbi:protein phosphatase, Mg2+/Mn2+ dependent, 1Nb (putative) [Garra rufa]|uniref:protein phosphatase, Mg2+/Mn2+ dependent, 1Nb (putative) n=1 Tax=Garra rufa TaxID=137080 RepID=UPI003CCE89F3